MAGGFVATETGKSYEGRVTAFVLMTCLVAATGGLLFGYDIGISGGVTSMEHFLKKFFPMVYRRVKDPHFHEGQYCKYDNHLLTLFTSSLYLAALVACFFASKIMKIFGRKVCMFVGALAFLAGATFNGIANNLPMLIAGRMLLGIGVGFSNQSVPVYLSEMAPTKLRGALNIGFQQAVNTGILSAGLINYGTAKITGGWGWRISLALAGAPAIIMTAGTFFLPDTPNSIIARGHPEKAKALLRKVRGSSNVEEEFQELVQASQAVKELEHPWKNILERKYRPQLVACVLIPFFQQVTGINVIMFYAPVLFKTLGFGDSASLMSAVISGAMLVIGTAVSIYAVDRFGRRVLFIYGGYTMIISQILVGAMVGWKFGVNGTGNMSKSDANLILFFICIYVVSFAWSWGPLGWLVPAEICPLEIRFVGQAVTVAVNMFFTFVIAQVFLTMLCHLKFGLFFFFAAWVGVMTAYVHFLLPETKNVPIEEINRLWLEHPFWRKYVADDDVGGALQAQPAEVQLKNV